MGNTNFVKGNEPSHHWTSHLLFPFAMWGCHNKGTHMNRWKKRFERKLHSWIPLDILISIHTDKKWWALVVQYAKSSNIKTNFKCQSTNKSLNVHELVCTWELLSSDYYSTLQRENQHDRRATWKWTHQQFNEKKEDEMFKPVDSEHRCSAVWTRALYLLRSW